MKAILLLLVLASPACSQIFPEDIKDPSVLRNMEFLYDEIAKGNAAAAGITSQNNSWTGTNQFTSTVVFSGTYQVQVAVPEGAVLQTGTPLCQATATYISQGSSVDAIFAGGGCEINARVVCWGVLVNGAYPSPYSASRPCATSFTGGGNESGNGSFDVQLAATAGVPTSYCVFSIAQSGDTFDWGYSDSLTMTFRVKESR